MEVKTMKKAFITFKLAFFLALTFVSYTMLVYFPSTPPFIRYFIPAAKVSLVDGDNYKVDERFLTWFDRDPERNIPDEPGTILAPADGVVQYIAVIDEAQHLVIEMRYTDVHVQRIPMDGKVIEIIGGGQKLPKDESAYAYAEEKMLPYQRRTLFDTEIGPLAVRQITSLFAARIEVFLETGDLAVRGERLGRVLAGSTVVLELPMDIEILVKPEQEVFGGETIVARY